MRFFKPIAIFSICIGSGILLSWLNILLEGNLEEGWIELGFHLVSEFLLAIVLIVSGILMLRRQPQARVINLTGLGMLIYSVVNAAGYYGQRGETLAMILFICLGALSLLAVAAHLGKASYPANRKNDQDTHARAPVI